MAIIKFFYLYGGLFIQIFIYTKFISLLKPGLGAIYLGINRDVFGRYISFRV